jgi:hypothetical protein
MASSQIAYAGSDVVVTLNVIDSTGTHQAATGLNASRLSSHPSAVPVVTNPNSEPGVYVLTWSSLSPATSEGDSIVALIEGSVGATAFSTYAIPLKVVANERGTDNASTFDNAVDTVITDAASRTASQADVSLLATAADLAVVDGHVDAVKAKTDQLAFTVANQVDANSLTGGTSPADIYTYFTSGANEDAFKADVTGLSTFDPASQSVTVGTNNDKTGYALSSAANDAIGAAFLAYTLTKGSPGTIERAFWQSLKATQLADGEVSGTPTASAFDTNLSAVTGAYDHLLLLFTSGSLAGEARPIATYNSTNGRITLQEALTAAPSSSDEFIVVPDHSHPVSEIVEGIFNEPQAGYTTAGTFGYYLDSQVSAAGGAVDTGAIADAVWSESRAGHTTSGTFGYYLDAQVSTAGAGGSGLYQVTVNVQNQDGDALQGARINVDGTTLTLVSDSAGQCVFNLDSGIYLLEMSPPAGYQTPVGNTITVTTSDISSTFTLTATAPSEDCDIPWVG